MDKDRILELLANLDERLQQRGVAAELYVVGGAAREKLDWIAKTDPRLYRAHLLKEGLRYQWGHVGQLVCSGTAPQRRRRRRVE